MIGFILLPFIFVGVILIIYIGNKHFKIAFNKYSTLLSILYSVFHISGYISLVLSYFVKTSNLKRFLFKYGYLWLGICLYLIIGLIISLIIEYSYKCLNKNKYNQKKSTFTLISFVLIFVLIMSIFGKYNAHNIKIRTHELEINKDSSLEALNIAFISDLHIGYNVELDEIKDLVSKINGLNADIVLIGGDIFDNSYNYVTNPDLISSELSKISSKYGTYTVLGNHDVESDLFLGFSVNLNKNYDEISYKMLDFLNKSRITILYDQLIDIENIQIYGRPDKEKINFNNNSRLSCEEITKNINTEQPFIVLEHEPVEYKECSENNVDLYLCGHTHDGQLFPFNLTSKLFWNNSSGYKKYENMHNIVTSGVGLFGIDMRIGTNSEIINIKLNFNKKRS